MVTYDTSWTVSSWTATLTLTLTLTNPNPNPVQELTVQELT